MGEWIRWSTWQGGGRPPAVPGIDKFASAVYADLQTNFPRQLMELQDFPWARQPLFMSHRDIFKYLLDYAKQLPPNVQIRSDKEVVDLYYEDQEQVVDGKKKPKNQGGFPTTWSAGGRWKLTFQGVSTRLVVTKNFGAVVVAVSVFDKSFWPPGLAAGLRAWEERWPGSISHSKTYRSPKPFRGKVSRGLLLSTLGRVVTWLTHETKQKVVIVGYGASGFDIAQKLTGHASKIWVFTGSLTTAQAAQQLPPGAELMPRLAGLEPRGGPNGRGRLVFEQERQLTRGVVDHVIFCTGYTYHHPFLSRGAADYDEPLLPGGHAIRDLYEHVVYAPNPSLAFVGLVKGGVPTSALVQAQAAFLARVWAGRDPWLVQSQRAAALLTDGLLSNSIPWNNPPSEAEYREIVCHEMPYPKFIDYLLRLERTCLEADGAVGSAKPKVKGAALYYYTYGYNEPFRWTVDHEWVLQHRREICTKFLSLGERERRKIISVEQLYPQSLSTSRSLAGRNRFEGVLQFLVLRAGYFEFADQDEEEPKLPHVTRKVFLGEGLAPLTLTYIEPAYLGTMDTFLRRAWRDLRPCQSRAMLVAGARHLLELCLRSLWARKQNVEAWRNEIIDASPRWERPAARPPGSTSSPDDEVVAKLDAVLKQLTGEWVAIRPLYHLLCGTTLFRHDEMGVQTITFPSGKVEG